MIVVGSRTLEGEWGTSVCVLDKSFVWMLNMYFRTWLAGATTAYSRKISFILKFWSREPWEQPFWRTVLQQHSNFIVSFKENECLEGGKLNRGQAERQVNVLKLQHWELRVGWPRYLECSSAAGCAYVKKRISYPYINNTLVIENWKTTDGGIRRTKTDFDWKIKD